MNSNNNHHKKLSVSIRSGGRIIAENKEIIQGIREIKSDVKEIKKFMVMNNLRRLVDNYDQIIQVKLKKIRKRLRISWKRRAEKKRNRRMG